jgi:putative nucleotidyltransferase-like protein
MQLMNVSPSEDVRRALVASGIPGDTSKPFPVVADWQSLMFAAHMHGLLPLVADRVQSAEYPPEAKRMFVANRLSYSSRLRQLERCLASVVTALDTASVPSIVLKGPALANAIYPDPMLRPYGDLDIVCREEDWLRTHAVLIGLGFTSKDDVNSPPPKVWRKKAYYHTQYYRESDAILVEVHYDLWQIGLRPKLGDRFWQRAEGVSIAGANALMLSAEDQLLHLCVHLHHHGYKRLIWFTDLAMLLMRRPEMDWRYVVWAARQEGVGASVYYCLLYLERLLGSTAPEWVRKELEPSALQAALHDRLWPADAIMNLNIDNTVSCGEFHEVPDATELLSNMVLSGRRIEKLMYLVRLLVPSNSWLAYYYGTTDKRALISRRVVHAPKILARMLGQCGMAIVRGVRGEPWVQAHEMH